MKTWLIVVSVVVVLLAAGTGVGFWMLRDALGERTDTVTELTNVKAEVTNIQTELTEIQQDLEDSFGSPLGEPSLYPWRETPDGRYAWCEEIEETISDLEERLEGLELPVGQAGGSSDIEARVQELEWSVQSLQWDVRDLEDAVQALQWQVLS